VPTKRAQKNWSTRAKPARKRETRHRPVERPRAQREMGAPRLLEAARLETVERRRAAFRGVKAAVGLLLQGALAPSSGLEPPALVERVLAVSIPASLPRLAARLSEE
jgi:hypothetical protein